MPDKDISITFEPNIAVAGQVLILQAIEFLYSLEVLNLVGWRNDVDALGDWRQFFSTVPGKLLTGEHVLTLKSAHSSSPVTEVVKGAAGPVEKLIEFLLQFRQKKEEGNVKVAKDKIEFVRDEYLPLIQKLRKAGVAQDTIKEMIGKATLYTDQVLTGLVAKENIRSGGP